jgi:hypothetical protein
MSKKPAFLVTLEIDRRPSLITILRLYNDSQI